MHSVFDLAVSALQIEKEVKAFSRSSRNVRTTIVVGGINMGEQRSDLRAGIAAFHAALGIDVLGNMRFLPNLVLHTTCFVHNMFCRPW